MLGTRARGGLPDGLLGWLDDVSIVAEARPAPQQPSEAGLGPMTWFSLPEGSSPRDQRSNAVLEFRGRQSATGEKVLKIECRIAVLPLSREIGQPRQQELLEFLSAHLSEEEIEFVRSLAIDLSPPQD